MESGTPKRILNNELKEKIYQEFITEKELAKRNNTFPLYLYSIRVFRAYKKTWRLIDRQLLNSSEINIMIELGCYKPPRNERINNYKNNIYIFYLKNESQKSEYC